MRGAFAAAVLLVVSGQAQAESVTYSAGFNSGQHQFGSFPQFDPQLGTLTSVEFSATGDLNAVFRIGPTFPPAPPVTFPVQGTLRQTLSFELARNPFEPGPTPLFFFTSSAPYTATSSQSEFSQDIDLSQTLTTFLERFYGTGRFDLFVGPTASLEIPDVPTQTIFLGAIGGASLTYNYETGGPVIPEPASIAMLPLGLAVVARLARRRRRRSGETRLADGSKRAE